MDFYKLLTETYDSKDWQYYKYSGMFKGSEILDAPSLCKGFIRDYVGKGCKYTDQIRSLLEELPNERVFHTVSCFFFGIAVFKASNKLKETLKKRIPLRKRGSFIEGKQSRFNYLWMLICLMHDMGYYFENEKGSLDQSSFSENLLELLSKRGRKRFTYKNRTIRNYEDYRECCMNVCDHGIVGGSLLFKDLCTLRERNEQYDEHHYWGKDLENDFLIAAMAIVNHNIFKCSEATRSKKCYRYFGLKELITTERLVKLKKDPFTFFLCLIDSIEPYKLFNDVKQLKRIIIELNDSSIRIDVSQLDDNKREKYLKKLEDINDWLTETERTELIITIKWD